MDTSPLSRFAFLSILAAVVTIGLKLGAYLLTGSVGLLSDALESLVNLVAALAALLALTIAARPADEEHAYGHTKVEYLASGFEGALILVAAGSIGVTAAPRLLHPEPISAAWQGIAISTLASAINLAVAYVLLRAGRVHHSIVLEAEAHHLLTDVWTSVGVLLGVAAVALTGWNQLDALIALVVAANIVWTGARLLRRSALGLLDTALPPEDLDRVRAILDQYAPLGVRWHALRSRQSGVRRFLSVHVLVPGSWTVQRGHNLLEEIEHEIHQALAFATIFTHLEPLDDPASAADVDLDRGAVA